MMSGMHGRLSGDEQEPVFVPEAWREPREWRRPWLTERDFYLIAALVTLNLGLIGWSGRDGMPQDEQAAGWGGDALARAGQDAVPALAVAESDIAPLTMDVGEIWAGPDFAAAKPFYLPDSEGAAKAAGGMAGEAGPVLVSAAGQKAVAPLPEGLVAQGAVPDLATWTPGKPAIETAASPGAEAALRPAAARDVTGMAKSAEERAVVAPTEGNGPAAPATKAAAATDAVTRETMPVAAEKPGLAVTRETPPAAGELPGSLAKDAAPVFVLSASDASAMQNDLVKPYPATANADKLPVPAAADTVKGLLGSNGADNAAAPALENAAQKAQPVAEAVVSPPAGNAPPVLADLPAVVPVVADTAKGLLGSNGADNAAAPALENAAQKAQPVAEAMVGPVQPATADDLQPPALAPAGAEALLLPATAAVESPPGKGGAKAAAIAGTDPGLDLMLGQVEAGILPSAAKKAAAAADLVADPLPSALVDEGPSGRNPGPPALPEQASDTAFAQSGYLGDSWLL